MENWSDEKKTPVLHYPIGLTPKATHSTTSSDADVVIDSQRRKWLIGGFGRLPIFCAADYLSMRVLSLLPVEPLGQIPDKKAS
ncbi:hypothetical protein RJ639_037574 [Escallonia herrerae]|uniref:Uncharacterized protein n=1 Tax=Escallonia herrerae TaxID=1293975 RepID=A0AA88WM92_9ASTE|nr:hypothetical protein RJ639_037574 [Escallonia herrerae]